MKQSAPTHALLRDLRYAAGLLLAVGALAWGLWGSWHPPGRAAVKRAAGREEVVFWHFWGGRHREVVEQIVHGFNSSQNRYFVRSIAMPGANLDLKFFLSVTGGSPPDLLNHDDPVVADWAHRGIIQPIDELIDAPAYETLRQWLFPAARELGSYQGRLYALCNGLDIRALYYDETLLADYGLRPPRSIAELDALATTIAPPKANRPLRRYGYLPDPRRIWAWGIVFGGRFYDASQRRVTADDEPIVRALEWMASYSRRYGAREVAAFRKGDQALAGSSFPLLEGRYAAIMDGQWRVPEIATARQAARRRGQPMPNIGVTALPCPPGGRENAGWVNGNFFVIPRRARNPQGAWAFARYWAGFGGFEQQAARHCAAGGWIPASQHVVDQPEFQDFLRRYPHFATFVRLASSENQVPTPAVPGAMYFYTQMVRAAEDAMYRERSPRQVLREAADRVRQRLDELQEKTPHGS